MLTTKDYKHFRVGDIVFEGADKALKALPGDCVTVGDGQVTGIVARVEHKHIVGTLELAGKIRYGMTSRNVPIYLFTPFAESYPPFFVGCSQKDVSKNVLAKIDFAHWDDGTCPRGTLTHIFGAAGDIAAEEAALACHASPIRWKKLEPLIEPEPLDYTPRGMTFHVDPPGCRDIDDAITLTPVEGGMEVKIHIADVASWLLVNPQLWMASHISQTLYKGGVAIHPMFPAELSEGRFSLLPGTDRRAWTLTFLWKGFVSEPSWSLEMIRVKGSYSYSSIHKSMFANDLEEICSGLAKRHITDSHEWIEQLMLFYNREAAKLLGGRGVLRRHAGKFQERFAAYEAAGLPADRLAVAAGEYCLGSDTNTRHCGLGEDLYCHASSPIRRWADCVNQLVMRRKILSSVAASQVEVDYMNARSKAIKAYERDLTFMHALLTGPKEVVGIVAEPGRVWVSAWGRIVKGETQLAAGTPVTVKYFCDATKRNWKRRMVLNITPQ